MGTTKWNKKENMEVMNQKKHEPFKKKKKSNCLEIALSSNLNTEIQTSIFQI